MRQLKSKLPKSWPLYIIKAAWDSTACYLKFQAKDDDDAIERAWKKMRRTEGGELCQFITIKRRID